MGKENRKAGKKEYICTSVSISKEEKDTFKPLSIFANSLYIPFLLEKAENLSEAGPYRIHNMGVKLSADKKDTYKKLCTTLKNKNISFSEYYKRYYSEFTEYLKEYLKKNNGNGNGKQLEKLKANLNVREIKKIAEEA